MTPTQVVGTRREAAFERHPPAVDCRTTDEPAEHIPATVIRRQHARR